MHFFVWCVKAFVFSIVGRSWATVRTTTSPSPPPATGCLAAAISHGVATPVDVVKTRLQTDGDRYGQSIIPAFQSLLREEGVQFMLQVCLGAACARSGVRVVGETFRNCGGACLCHEGSCGVLRIVD